MAERRGMNEQERQGPCFSLGAVRSSEPEAQARAGYAVRGGGRESQPGPSLALRARTGSDPVNGEGSRHAVCFSLGALLGDLRRHPELDIDTLAYHVRQSDATAAEGYWHAAINEARSFLEALTVGILHAVRPEPAEKSHGNGTTNGTPFRTYRRYLVEAGFIDAEENELLQYVYGVASAKGSHHGVADEGWSRLARRMVFTTGQYLIRHYEDWRAAGARRAAAERDVQTGVRVKSRWGWLGGLIRLR